MNIAVLANLKEDAPVNKEDPPGRWDDLDDRGTVDAILLALTELGHNAQYFPATLDSINDLRKFTPDLCFNSSEGHYGDSREAQMPAILDSLRIPYTCAGVLGMSLSHNKAVAKEMFRDAHIPTANFVVVRDGVNGFVVGDPADAAAVAGRFARLLDAGLRQRMGQEAFRTACGQSWDEVARRQIEIYEELLSTSSSGA